MEIFWRLVLGHLIGDFTLQTNYIAAWKRRSIWGVWVHCAIHPVIYALLLWRYLGQVWFNIGSVPFTGAACLIIIFFAHFVEDEWRILSVSKRSAPDNTFFYLWDQVIHYAVIFAVSPVVDSGMTSSSKFGFMQYPSVQGVIPHSEWLNLGFWQKFSTITRPEDWVFIGILFVILTHFTTVTIYFIEKDFFGGEFPGDQEKYIAMAERLLVAGCFLLPGYWWASVVAVWILSGIIYKYRKIYDSSWTNLLMGNFFAIVCGALTRALLYS